MRRALLIATDNFSEPSLRTLGAPKRDVEALRRVLVDPNLGGFDMVELMYNENSAAVTEKIEDFFTAESAPSDFVLLYLSGHGVLDGADRLCFAMPNTSMMKLRSTAVPATLVHQMMDEGPRQQLVILDCCYSGSFVSGNNPKGDQVALAGHLGPADPAGRGRTILTATNRFQYAFERVSSGDHPTSLYTSALVEGIRTGAADLDGDGLISADELHDYTVEQLRRSDQEQEPHRWALGTSGVAHIASAGAELPTSPAETTVEIPIPAPQLRTPSESVRGRLSPRHVLGALVSLVVAGLVAAALFQVAARSGDRVVIEGDGNTVLGDNSEVTIELIEQLTVSVGDSPEEKATKVERRTEILTSLVLDNLVSLDTRLDLLRLIMADDGFGGALASVRDDVAPSSQEVFEAGYNELLSAQRQESLRSILADTPLKLIEPSLLTELLLDTRVPAATATTFVDALVAIDDRYGQLLDALGEVGEPELCSSSLAQEFQERNSDILVALVETQSEVAFALGQSVLAQTGQPTANMNARLSSLRILEPRNLPSANQANAAAATAVADYELALATRSDLNTLGVELLDANLECYIAINRDLSISADDPWNMVVAKAISLRQLGRQDEAIAAFELYRQMFSSSDPTADRYAATAQTFTEEMDSFSVVDGAVYVWAIEPGTQAAGRVEVGDVVIELNNQAVRSVPDFERALAARDGVEALVMLVLRLDAGRFTLVEFEFEPVTIGISVMPI